MGQRRVATILFSDLRGFTSFSENLPVEELIDVLNQYFNLMTDIILKNRGMLNKFIGDAIMAIYNVPVNDPHHAPHAVITAMEMKKELEQLNSVLSAKGKGDLQLQMGIGIHTGEVFAGNVGARQRKEYTVMGDAVNLASRIEQLNKEFLTSILISEETYKLVKDYVDVLDKGLVEIRGRKHGVRVFELKKAGGES